MLRQAKSSATSAITIKNSRYGSSSVRFPIQAPLTPRVTRTRGPRQHVDARIAANPPENNAIEPDRLDFVVEATGKLTFAGAEAAESTWQHKLFDLKPAPPPACIVCSLRARPIRSAGWRTAADRSFQIGAAAHSETLEAACLPFDVQAIDAYTWRAKKSECLRLRLIVNLDLFDFFGQTTGH